MQVKSLPWKSKALYGTLKNPADFFGFVEQLRLYIKQESDTLTLNLTDCDETNISQKEKKINLFLHGVNISVYLYTLIHLNCWEPPGILESELANVFLAIIITILSSRI